MTFPIWSLRLILKEMAAYRKPEYRGQICTRHIKLGTRNMWKFIHGELPPPALRMVAEIHFISVEYCKNKHCWLEWELMMPNAPHERAAEGGPLDVVVRAHLDKA